MIGTDLNLNLPSLSDTYSVVVGKIATALQAIEDSIAEAATPAGLDITGNLDIDGNHLVNVGGIVLAAGNAPASAGSIYYSGGNFYAKDATGVIQLTSAGSINVAGVGGIGGDYGGVNPATVDFHDGSGQYRFKEDGTTWADGVFDDVLLMHSGGVNSVRQTAPTTLSASYTVLWPEALPGSTGVVTLANDGQLSTTTAVSVATVAASTSITAPVYYYTTEETIQLGAENGMSGGTHVFVPQSGRWNLGNSSTDEVCFPLRIRNGDTITGWSVAVSKQSDATNTLTARLERVDVLTGAQVTVGTEQTLSTNAPGSHVFSQSGLSELVTASYTYRIVALQSDATPSAVDYVYGAFFGRKYIP